MFVFISYEPLNQVYTSFALNIGLNIRKSVINKLLWRGFEWSHEDDEIEDTKWRQ